MALRNICRGIVNIREITIVVLVRADDLTSELKSFQEHLTREFSIENMMAYKVPVITTVPWTHILAI